MWLTKTIVVTPNVSPGNLPMNQHRKLENPLDAVRCTLVKLLYPLLDGGNVSLAGIHRSSALKASTSKLAAWLCSSTRRTLPVW